MPQVHITLAPGVLKKLGYELLDRIGRECEKLVEFAFNISSKLKDTAYTAIEAVAVHNEADIQIEIRYTAGYDEYGQGKPFNPSRNQQEHLRILIIRAVVGLLGNAKKPLKLSVSIWTKPHYNSVFETTHRSEG